MIKFLTDKYSIFYCRKRTATDIYRTISIFSHNTQCGISQATGAVTPIAGITVTLTKDVCGIGNIQDTTLYTYTTGCTVYFTT